MSQDQCQQHAVLPCIIALNDKKPDYDFAVRKNGAGRPSKQDQYKNLIGLLLQLFDGSSEGLRAHPI